MVMVKGRWETQDGVIELIEDKTPYFQMLVKVLSVVLGLIIALSIVAVIVWKNRIYVLVAYKRSRLRKYDKGKN